MRFTIERIRTLVVVCAVLLVVALGVFLTVGRFKNPFSRRDIPQRLGINIQQEANGVTYTQAHGGHTVFKIHASRVVQLKSDRALLHDVEIELYSADGKSVDRIQGNEFEYDQKAGTATAAGPVEITLTRPGGAPAAAAKVGRPAEAKTRPSASPSGQIHVRTSGLTFDQKSGMVTTSQRVDFAMAQGSGSSLGASYDSQQGYLVLNHDVELTARPASARAAVEPVEVHAARAEFYRDTNLCILRSASAEYRGSRADAANAQILFRDDGSAARLEATGGLTLTAPTGGRLVAPTGSVDFDQRNQPLRGHLAGGVTLVSVNAARTVHGTAPTMDIEFAARGELRHAHLERGVEMRSEATGPGTAQAHAVPVHVSRTWRSPMVDIDFRSAGPGRAEPAAIHGTGGVVVTDLTQRGHTAPQPSKLAADALTATFGPNSALQTMTGIGHAAMEQTSTAGAHETATGDCLQAQFAAAGSTRHTNQGAASAGANADQIQSAVLDGNVRLTQLPAARPGAPPPAQTHATAARAVYESLGEWLHLTGSPRIESGGLQLTADRIDVSQTSGDAFAHGNVKGTWINSADGQRRPPEGALTLGGEGPAHVVAAEAQLEQSVGQATFRGKARLWQQVNSISAPVIVLDRQRQTLLARAATPADPVIAVLVSTGSPGAGRRESPKAGAEAKPATPSVIRVRGGELRYSDVERRAVIQGGILGAVTAAMGEVASTSSRVELQLTPTASRATSPAPPGQVERMTASGHVVITAQGRRGTGEQLVYTGADGTYRLTGTPAEPPKMTDPERGSVTGDALIFRSGDDSVSIEGGARETRTETTAPR